MQGNARRTVNRLALIGIILISTGCSLDKACIMSGRGACTVCEMSPEWHPTPRSCNRPIDLSLLKRPTQPEVLVHPSDVLGVYVEGVISGDAISSGGSELPTTVYTPTIENVRQPTPVTGRPVEVHADGTIYLPLIGPLSVVGMSLQQVANTVREAYVDAGQLKRDRDGYTIVSLMKPRVNRILVIREDAPADALTLKTLDSEILTKRGTAMVVELTEENSDILNALVASGGLPGEDARNDVWILRNNADWNHAAESFQAGMHPEEIIEDRDMALTHSVIRLRQPCGEPLSFAQPDVVLHNGDVVFIEKRHEEYFYTGGLLQAGRISLPRDEDIDILEAIAMANTGLGGPSGLNAATNQFRNTPGNIIPATRAIVLRKLPGGNQVKIDIDLRAAMTDPAQRILIAPEDFVMLHYRPQELAGNIAINLVTFGANLN